MKKTSLVLPARRERLVRPIYEHCGHGRDLRLEGGEA